MRFFEFGKEIGRKFSFLFGWERKGKEKFVVLVWEEKGREKNCILVREGNGKDKMSFPSVGRKWEGNIEIL